MTSKEQHKDIVLGDGDVHVYAAHFNHAREVCVGFCEGKGSGVVGESMYPEHQGKLVEDTSYEPDTRLVFKNIESLEVVLNQLLHARKLIRASNWPPSGRDLKPDIYTVLSASELEEFYEAGEEGR